MTSLTAEEIVRRNHLAEGRMTIEGKITRAVWRWSGHCYRPSKVQRINTNQAASMGRPSTEARVHRRAY